MGSEPSTRTLIPGLEELQAENAILKQRLMIVTEGLSKRGSEMVGLVEMLEKGRIGVKELRDVVHNQRQEVEKQKDSHDNGIASRPCEVPKEDVGTQYERSSCSATVAQGKDQEVQTTGELERVVLVKSPCKKKGQDGILTEGRDLFALKTTSEDLMAHILDLSEQLEASEAENFRLAEKLVNARR